MRLLLSMTLACSLIGCGTKSSSPDPGSSGAQGLSQSSGNAASTGGAPTEADAASAVEQLVQRAQSAVAARQGRVAVEALSQAIGIDAGQSKLFHMRADVYNLMGEYANARADFSLAVQLDPTNAELYNARGYFLMTRGVSSGAMADFNESIKLNPKYPVAWNNRGLIRLAQKNWKAAVFDFGKAVELDSKYVDALNNRGFAQMKHGKLDEALADLKQTVKIKPDYTTAWNNCGLVFMQQENYPAAVSAFSEAIKLAPMDARWLNHRRAAWQKLEKFEEANVDEQKIRWIETLTQLTTQATQKQNDPAAWLARADHLVKGDELAAALQDYGRAITLRPTNKRALTGRASALMKMGEASKAILDCNTIIAEDSSPTAYSIRGDAWLSLRDFDKAISDFEMAQRMDDVVVDTYQKRAAQRTAGGKAQLAKEDLAKARQLEDALAGRLPQRTAGQQIPFPTN